MRPLDEVYAAVFIDAIVIKVSDGQVANRPIYADTGVTFAAGGEPKLLIKIHRVHRQRDSPSPADRDSWRLWRRGRLRVSLGPGP